MSQSCSGKSAVFDFIFKCFWAPRWDAKWILKWSLETSKIRPQNRATFYKLLDSLGFQTGPKEAQDRPRWAQRKALDGQNRPKMTKTKPKEGQDREIGPKETQDSAKASPRGPIGCLDKTEERPKMVKTSP